eukprot:8231264-Ditylum_brightwellii.AAC.1
MMSPFCQQFLSVLDLLFVYLEHGLQDDKYYNNHDYDDDNNNVTATNNNNNSNDEGNDNDISDTNLIDLAVQEHDPDIAFSNN